MRERLHDSLSSDLDFNADIDDVLFQEKPCIYFKMLILGLKLWSNGNQWSTIKHTEVIGYFTSAVTILNQLNYIILLQVSIWPSEALPDLFLPP